MAKKDLLSPEARQYIIDNCTMTGEELRKQVKEKYGVDVTIQAVLEHARRARRTAEEATKNCDAFISKKISQRVDKKVVPLMEIMEREIKRLSDALDGIDPTLRVKPEYDSNGNLTGYVQSREYALLGKELRENIKAYVDLRPKVMTVKIDQLDADVEREFLDMCSPEDVAYIMKLKKQWEDKKKSEHPEEEGE